MLHLVCDPFAVQIPDGKRGTMIVIAIKREPSRNRSRLERKRRLAPFWGFIIGGSRGASVSAGCLQSSKRR